MTKKRKLPVSYRNSLRSSSIIKGIVLAAAQHRGATYWAIVGLVSLVLVFFLLLRQNHISCMKNLYLTRKKVNSRSMNYWSKSRESSAPKM